LAARIRTTIPDNLLALNVSLQQSITVKQRDKTEKSGLYPPKGIKRGATNQVNQSTNGLTADTVKSGRGLFCVPIPYPWKLSVFPNPSKGPITLGFTQKVRNGADARHRH